MYKVKWIFRGVVVISIPLLVGCGLLPATMSTQRCVAGANVKPGMTERDVVGLLGKPYGLMVNREKVTYTWMDEDSGRRVGVDFAHPADGKMDDAVVLATRGWCGDGKSFDTTQ